MYNNIQIVELLIKDDSLVKGNAVIIDFYDFKNPMTSAILIDPVSADVEQN